MKYLFGRRCQLIKWRVSQFFDCEEEWSGDSFYDLQKEVRSVSSVYILYEAISRV